MPARAVWSRSTFHEHLASTHGAERGAALAAHVEKQMHEVIGASLRATQDVIEPRAASFALFGLDFLIGSQLVDRRGPHGSPHDGWDATDGDPPDLTGRADYRVWLLEANSSPDMSRNAPVLRKIVEEATDDLITLVLASQQPGASAAKLAAERREREGPCWRLVCRAKPATERELHRRFWEKKCGVDQHLVPSSSGLNHTLTSYVTLQAQVQNKSIRQSFARSLANIKEIYVTVYRDPVMSPTNDVNDNEILNSWLKVFNKRSNYLFGGSEEI